MRTFSINTLGCKVNQYESQQIRTLLEQWRLRQADSWAQPDLVIVNTCCVTRTASAKSRQCIQKALRLNPGAAIVVCGCLAAIGINEIGPLGPNVHFAPSREELADKLRQIARPSTVEPAPATAGTARAALQTDNPKTTPTRTVPCSGPATLESTDHHLAMPLLNSFKGQTRAFLKVQDGCDRRCSYCIVPRTRPLVRSKPLQTTLAEARRLVAAGHREIVLTGVCLGAYGQPTTQRRKWPGQRNTRLAQLLDELAGVPGLSRIRLSSLDPADVTPELLDVMSGHDNIMPHLHLSLQSGSARILKRMCRQYTAAHFCRIVEQARARLDRPAITTDIIVGFPGETDADFEQTVALARRIGFSRIHVFTYSPRQGTAAAGMQGRVSSEVLKQRSGALLALNDRLARRFREQFIGQTARVLVEAARESLDSNDARPARPSGAGALEHSPSGGCCAPALPTGINRRIHDSREQLLVGRSERYFTVYVPQDRERPQSTTAARHLLTVKLIRNGKDGLFGQIV